MKGLARKLVFLITGIAAAATSFNTVALDAMRFSADQLIQVEKWMDSLPNYKAPDSYVSKAKSNSVLSRFHYTPRLRDQHSDGKSTGTCWIWSSTAIMAMNFDLQYNSSPILQEGFSVQFVANSAWMVGSDFNSGGHIGLTKEFFDMIGFAVPWSNKNAEWRAYGGSENFKSSWIYSTPNYPVENIENSQVLTWELVSADAKNNIKSVIDSGKPVWFLYFLPTDADWAVFEKFWAEKSQNEIINLDYARGHTWDDGGCGHATVCVGYDETDSDPAKHYWIILNSHGTADGLRPDGVFRLSMNIDYSSTVNGVNQGLPFPYMYFFAKMDTTFASEASPKGLKSLSVSMDNSRPDSDSVAVSEASFDEAPPAIHSGILTLNTTLLGCDSSNGSWTSKNGVFSFKTFSKVKPSIQVTIDTKRKIWSAKAAKASLGRYVDCNDGLKCKFEYFIAPPMPGEKPVLLGEKAAPYDQVSAKSSGKLPLR